MRRGRAEAEQELGSVQVVRHGTAVGYDNPGFQSPWARPGPSGLDWPYSPQIVCEGSSTPARDNCLKQADTDSAFQEPSIAVSSYILLKELTVTSALSRPPPTKAVTLSFLRRPPTRATSATSPWMTRTTTLCVTETSRGCCSPAPPCSPCSSS